MFAIVRTGGKQYKVSPGDVLTVEKVKTATDGGIVELRDVLALSSASGELQLAAMMGDEVKVCAEVLRTFKDRKVLVFKKKRRHNYRRKNGHRQQLCTLKIREIFIDAETSFAAPAVAPAVVAVQAVNSNEAQVASGGVGAESPATPGFDVDDAPEVAVGTTAGLEEGGDIPGVDVDIETGGGASAWDDAMAGDPVVSAGSAASGDEDSSAVSEAEDVSANPQ